MAIIEKRKLQNGTSTYRAKIRIKGYPQQTQTFKRLTDAKKWIQKTEAEIIQGKFFPKTEASKHTLSEAIARYRKTHLSKKSLAMQDSQATQLRWWEKQLGSCFMANITPALIAECRDKLMSEPTSTNNQRAPGTCNRYLAILGHLFTIAEREWEWIDKNPVRKIKRFQEPSGRTRFLDHQEKNELLNTCKSSNSPYLYLIVLIALSTGMRHTEILTLNWKQINFKEKSIILYKTKNKEIRKVPIHGQALIELEKHAKIRRIDSELVFPSKYNPNRAYNIRSAWRYAVKQANIKNFCFHDLRHTAASYFSMSGATARDLCDIFGWKKMQMAMRYAHLFESHTNELVAKMNEKFL